MKRIPRWMRIAGKASVSLAVLGFLARNLSGAELVAIVRSLDATLLVVGLAQMLLIPVLGGVRWKLILKALNERQSLGSLISIFWAAWPSIRCYPPQSAAMSCGSGWRFAGGSPLPTR